MTSTLPRQKAPREPARFPRGLSRLPAPASSAASAGPPPTAAAPRPAAAAPAALGLGPRLVDDQVPIPKQAPVQHLDGLGQLFLGRHLDEAEAAGPAGKLIGNDTDGFERAGLLEELAQVFFCRLEGEITDEKLYRHRGTSCRDQDRVDSPPARQRRQGKPSARGPRQADPQRGRYPTDGPTTCQANLAAECSLFHYVMPLLGCAVSATKIAQRYTPRVMAPSTVMVIPVRYEARSDARKHTTSATSCGSAMRPSGNS